MTTAVAPCAPLARPSDVWPFVLRARRRLVSGILVAVAGALACGDGRRGAAADAGGEPADAAVSDSFQLPPEADRLTMQIVALHHPRFIGSPRRMKDPDALLLKLEGVTVPALDGFSRDDGTRDPDGRAWSVGYAGDLTLSARRGDTPAVEVARDTFRLVPVTMTDPLIHPTPYLEYALPPVWAIISGAPGAYALRHHAIDYDPPAPQKWRLSIVNSRLDTAVSAELFEINDKLEVVPDGWRGMLFEHVAPGAAVMNVEVTSPRVRVGMRLTADSFPPTVPAGNFLPFVAPNAWPDVPGMTLRIPDGTIIQINTAPSLPDRPDAVDWQTTTFVFMCRDPEYKDLVLAHDSSPTACWASARGPRAGTASGAGALRAPGVAPAPGGFVGSTCVMSAGGARCTPHGAAVPDR